jgi:hypothetical protein
MAHGFLAKLAKSCGGSGDAVEHAGGQEPGLIASHGKAQLKLVGWRLQGFSKHYHVLIMHRSG